MVAWSSFSRLCSAVTQKNNDTSSSDEEDRCKLLQAIDKGFINDDIFKGKSVHEVCKSSLPSLRCGKADQADQNITGIHVTPEFQQHVAKHLSSMLDRQIKEVDKSKKIFKMRQNDRSGGVKLLPSSINFLEVNDLEYISVAHNTRRKKRRHKVNTEEENMKVVESAVSAEWILSGEAVKGWATSTRGEVIPGLFKPQGNIATNQIGVSLSKKKKKIKKKVDKHGIEK